MPVTTAEKIRLGIYTISGVSTVVVTEILFKEFCKQTDYITINKRQFNIRKCPLLKNKLLYRGLLPFTVGVYGASFMYHACALVVDPIVLLLKSL